MRRLGLRGLWLWGRMSPQKRNAIWIITDEQTKAVRTHFQSQ
jgi:hypothetical protein